MNLILVEDDAAFRNLARSILENDSAFREARGSLTIFSGSAELLKSETLEAPDAIFLDLCCPEDPKGLAALEAIPQLRRRYPRSELWVQSGLEDLRLMKSAIQKGAHRFVSKDGLLSELPFFLQALVERQSFRSASRETLWGESAAIQDLRESIVKLKFSGIVDILVEGETGSGKEVCARLLHTEGPFVAVNCAAVPADLFEAEFFGSEKGAFTGSTQARPGYLENAGNGTLFLDEIQSLPIEQQAKLLRVLESRKFRRVGGAAEKDFRARVISASNLRLTERVARGLFREDLYYRLSTLRLCVPPLRARREDITSLLTRMVTDSSQGRLSLESEALLWASDSYEWPGNFRELKSLATRLSLTHPIPRVDLESLRGVLEPIVNEVAAPFSGAVAFAIDWSAGLDANVERLEKCMVMKALGLAKTSEARDFLKIGRTRFYEKLREFGLSREP